MTSLLDDRMKGQGTAQGAQGIALLNTTAVEDFMLSQIQEGPRAITTLQPGRH